MNIRDEVETDYRGVRQIVEAAFGQPQEADLIEALRHGGGAEFSIIATDETGAIIGHIMLSKMTAPVRALGLAPVSVKPDQQGAGIGSALIREGINRATENGWQAIFLLGAPGYYTRFGFDAGLAKQFSSPYAGPYFMALELEKGVLKDRSGAVEYARAFGDL